MLALFIFGSARSPTLQVGSNHYECCSEQNADYHLKKLWYVHGEEEGESIDTSQSGQGIANRMSANRLLPYRPVDKPADERKRGKYRYRY